MQTSLLQVDGLGVSYGQSQIIESLSLDAKEGEILAVMGLNGMGKTTLMKAMMGIVPVKGGKVSLEGHDLTNKEPFERVAAGLAYVPQGRMVFPTLTVQENIETGLRSDKEEVPDELYELFPVLKEMRSRRAGNLSGGQQQQLVIARALASRPKVLLLDEPTEGIQPSIIKELAVVLKEIRDRKRLTILVSEQVLSFALSVADRVMVINKGKIIHESTRQDTDETVMKQLLSI
ncbi:MAG: urea transporter ATP-binding subunit UrtE [Myxococcaceae bacterium]|nr:urea transporter ATP-binding subunit UrtE [Myxococcaceae bacterium]